VGYLVHAHQRNFLYEQSLRQTQNLARTLAVSSTSWVLSNDVIGLQEVTQGLAQTEDLKFAAVLSRQGEVLASTRAAQVGLFFTDALSRHSLRSAPVPQVLVNQPGLIDVAVPVMAGSRHLGWVRVETTQASANANLRNLTFVGFGFVIIAVALSTLSAALLARRLTRGLSALVQVVGTVGQSGAGPRATVLGEDEIGRLARDFNRMLDLLDVQRQHIERSNIELAMYNRILRQIGLGVALPEVLKALARQLVSWYPGISCAVFVLDQEARCLRLQASSGVSREFRQALDSLPLSEAGGSSALAARDGVPVVTEDTAADPHWERYRGLAAQAGLQSCWSYPIIGGDRRVLGVFTLYRQQAGAPSQEAASLIEQCAQLAGLAIERQRQEESLRIAATAFESQEGLYIMDAQRIILRVNHAFTRITGFEPQEVVGHPVSVLRSGHHDDAFYQAMWAQVDRTDSWQGEITNRHKDGKAYAKWLTITVVRDPQGAISHYVGGFFDITQRKQAEAEIEQLAFYDPLTGLPNRRLLLDRLHQALALSRRHQQHGALLFLDMDNFKSLNDTLGHVQGDLLLQQVAQRLKSCVRESDTVARLGGDEFVVMLEGRGGVEAEAAVEAEAVSEKVLAALNQAYELKGVKYHSSASIGVTLYGGDDAATEDLLKRADLALYQAKAAGRNTLRFFDPRMQATINARVALESDLRAGLAAQQFLLHYQPQVDLLNRLMGVEALLRWQHPERGMVSPAQFIPLAEETGLILPLGHWVLEAACQQLRRWQASAATAALTISVNVSALQFRQKNFVKDVLAALERSGARPETLKLELTESMLLSNVEDTIDKMQTLRGHGIGFSLDDFGTGYSSLSYLKRLPLDQLKIDGSFVKDAANNPHDAAIIQTIVALGSSMEMNVIAEGVETEEQRDVLSRLGCHRYQGYLFGRPGPVEALAPYLPAP
jgi:diguanylate cyclase (GGDEF)-like protein/PAS domain S-box-containing protein